MDAVFLSRRRFLAISGGIATVTALAACNRNEMASSPSTSPSNSQPLGIRNTQFGPIQGQFEGVNETYFNVPYGKPPTQELRWTPPQDPDSWSEILDCTHPHLKALQMHRDPQASPNVKPEMVGSADCLRLDVYTRTDADNWPVMVYLHGGNNQSGSAQEIPGTEVVKGAEAVYVSIDYRLGLLGFNALPALHQTADSSGNFALLDIAHALRWVRKNISAFGGDPKNVTLSGFSAGGRNVMAALISPALAGLFDRAIVFSGGMTIADQDESARAIARSVAPLAVEDGKAADIDSATEWLLQPATEVREYLYGISEDRLVPLMGDAGIRMSVFPHLYGDGVTLPKDGFASGMWSNDVPVMMLTGQTEFSMFAMGSPVYEQLGEEADAARDFAIRYGSELYRIFNTQSSAAAMTDSYKSEIYLIQVAYGSCDSAYPIQPLGSFHGIFAPMLGCPNYDAIYDFSESGYQSMATVFFGYLRNFLHGVPIDKGMEVSWPEWNSHAKTTLILDAADGKAAVKTADVYRKPKQIIDQLGADSALSEPAKQRVIKEILNGRWFSSELDSTYATAQAVHLK